MVVVANSLRLLAYRVEGQLAFNHGPFRLSARTRMTRPKAAAWLLGVLLVRPMATISARTEARAAHGGP